MRTVSGEILQLDPCGRFNFEIFDIDFELHADEVTRRWARTESGKITLRDRSHGDQAHLAEVHDGKARFGLWFNREGVLAGSFEFERADLTLKEVLKTFGFLDGHG